jgi:hypothetical protein
MSAVLVAPRVWMPTKTGIEVLWDKLDAMERRVVDRFFGSRSLRDRFAVMAGSDANYLSAKLAGLAFGKTAYAGDTPIFVGLWTAALDDTFTGATANETTYTSYARMSLTNNNTIFAAGSGTTTTTNTWPSDSTKSWAPSTGGSSTITYLGALNGNAGSSADKGMVWCTVNSVLINSGDTPQLAQNAVSQTRD